VKQRGDKFGNFFVFHALTISKKGGEPPKCWQLLPTRLGTGEELPEAAQDLSRQPHEPVSPHACKLLVAGTDLQLVDRCTLSEESHKAVLSNLPQHL